MRACNRTTGSTFTTSTPQVSYRTEEPRRPRTQTPERPGKTIRPRWKTSDPEGKHEIPRYVRDALGIGAPSEEGVIE